MQKILPFISFLFVFFISSFAKQSGLDEVISALRSGNATELAKYMDNSVQVALPDKTDTYTKAQALDILQNFFTANEVKTFDVKHSGDTGGNQFCIGTLQTKTGSYRTTVFMKQKSSVQVVKEIRFQAE